MVAGQNVGIAEMSQQYIARMEDVLAVYEGPLSEAVTRHAIGLYDQVVRARMRLRN
jgi:hypothetical protein